MVDPYDNGGGIVWSSEIANEGSGFLIPFSPTIVDGKTILLPTKNGPVYAFDAKTGKLLAKKYLGLGEITAGNGYFSTINSACVHDNRVYITTECPVNINVFRKMYLGRLFAVDVNVDAENDNEILKVAWYFPFIGRSQASPLLIGDTIYFDVYTSGFGPLEKPYVYAVTDKGEYCKEKWRKPYPKFLSFPHDARGKTWFLKKLDIRSLVLCSYD